MSNKSFLDMTRFDEASILKSKFVDLLVPDEYSQTMKFIDKIKDKGFVENYECTMILQDKSIIMLNLSATLMPDSKRVLISMRDVTELKKSEKNITDYMGLVDENIITSSTDKRGTITSASEYFCKISGYTRQELIGQNHRIIRHPDMPDSLYKDLWDTIKVGKAWRGEVKNLTKDGGFYWVDATIYPRYDSEGEKIGYTAIRLNITDKKLIEKISVTDWLTQLFNRRYFNEIFPQTLSSLKREGEFVAFFIMDIDNFKLYNDTFGHQMGDIAIQKVSKTLSDWVIPPLLVALKNTFISR